MVRAWSPCACVVSWSLFPQTRARTGGLWSQFFTSAFVHGRSVRHPRLRGLANAQCDYGSHSLLAVSLVGTLTTVGHRALGVGRCVCRTPASSTQCRRRRVQGATSGKHGRRSGRASVLRCRCLRNMVRACAVRALCRLWQRRLDIGGGERSIRHHASDAGHRPLTGHPCSPASRGERTHPHRLQSRSDHRYLWVSGMHTSLFPFLARYLSCHRSPRCFCVLCSGRIG